MSSDPGTLPPVPAGYGTLEGGPREAEAVVPRPTRRRAKAGGASGQAGSTANGLAASPATGPEQVVAPDQVAMAQQLAVPEQVVAPDFPGAPSIPNGLSPAVDYRDPPDHRKPPEYGDPPDYRDPSDFRNPRPQVFPDGTDPEIFPVPPVRRPWWRGPEVRREERAARWPDGAEEYVPRRGWRREKVRMVRGRRSRRIVRRIDTWTVLKVSLVFYICVLIVVLISGIVLWNVAQAFNFTHDIEKSVKTLFGYNSFTLHPTPMFEYTALGGVVLSVVGTLVNLLVAMTYNLIADVVGGIQIVVVTEEVDSGVR